MVSFMVGLPLSKHSQGRASGLVGEIHSVQAWVVPYEGYLEHTRNELLFKGSKINPHDDALRVEYMFTENLVEGYHVSTVTKGHNSPKLSCTDKVFIFTDATFSKENGQPPLALLCILMEVLWVQGQQRVLGRAHLKRLKRGRFSTQ